MDLTALPVISVCQVSNAHRAALGRGQQNGSSLVCIVSIPQCATGPVLLPASAGN